MPLAIISIFNKEKILVDRTSSRNIVNIDVKIEGLYFFHIFPLLPRCV